jgi:hypothetical protein
MGAANRETAVAAPACSWPGAGVAPGIFEATDFNNFTAIHGGMIAPSRA